MFFLLLQSSFLLPFMSWCLVFLLVSVCVCYGQVINHTQISDLKINIVAHWSIYQLYDSTDLGYAALLILSGFAHAFAISWLVSWGLLDLEWPQLHGLLVTMEVKVLDLYVYMVAWADSHGRAGFQGRPKGKASWGLALRQTECHFHTLWSYPIDQSNSQDQFQFNGGQICPTS